MVLKIDLLSLHKAYNESEPDICLQDSKDKNKDTITWMKL